MKKILFLIILLSTAVVYGQSLDSLALTPPMGWNSWNCFHQNIDEKQIREIADLMVTTGMRDAGYEYLNLDDCWQIGRDENGEIMADPKNFPSGIKALADYVHSKGLKFGLYSCGGTMTCAKRPGSRGHEYQDARTYAKWGVDFLKYDWCHNNDANAKEAYTLMSNALKSTARPILFSICEWGHNKAWEWGKGIGHMWRISEDIIPVVDGNLYWGGASIFSIIDLMEPLWPYAGPGHWNDAEMLQVGNGDLTYEENKMHFSMWCMLAAPLLAGNDLRNMDKNVLEILTNKEAIAINQDKLGKQGRLHQRTGKHEIWVKELSKGEAAICFLNRDDKVWVLDYKFEEYPLVKVNCNEEVYNLRDIWQHKNVGDTSRKYAAEIPPHGVVLLRLSKK